MCSKTYWTFKSWLIWFPFFFIPYSISSTTSQLLIWFTIIPLFTLFFFTQTQINSLFFIDRFWLLSLFFLFPIDSFSFFNLLIRTFDLLIYSLVPFLTLALSYLVLFFLSIVYSILIKACNYRRDEFGCYFYIFNLLI